MHEIGGAGWLTLRTARMSARSETSAAEHDRPKYGVIHELGRLNRLGCQRFGASSISNEGADYFHSRHCLMGRARTRDATVFPTSAMTRNSIGGRFKSSPDRETPPAIEERAFRVLGDEGPTTPPIAWILLW